MEPFLLRVWKFKERRRNWELMEITCQQKMKPRGMYGGHIKQAKVPCFYTIPLVGLERGEPVS